MSTRRRAEPGISDADTQQRSRLRHEPDAPPASPLAARIHHSRTAVEAEERYIAARTEWITAMKAAASGRPSDMAALAIAQEAYEHAMAERDRWLSGKLVAVPIQTEAARDTDVVVEQELSWRKVHEPPTPKAGLVRRVLGRLTGH